MPTKPGLKSKIEYYGLGEKITDWIFKDKLSGKEICDRLFKEDGIELSEGSISNFKKFVLATVPDFLEQNEQYKNNLAKKFLDTIENLIFALDEIKEKISQFQDPKQWKQHSTYIMELLQLLHLLLKRAGEIKPAQFIEKQEVNMIMINQTVQMEIVRLIDEGQIPLETCAEPVKEFYRKMKKNANVF